MINLIIGVVLGILVTVATYHPTEAKQVLGQVVDTVHNVGQAVVTVPPAK